MSAVSPHWHSSCIPEQPRASGEGPRGTNRPWRRLCDGEGVQEGWELQPQSHHPTRGVWPVPNSTAPPGVFKRACSVPDLSFLTAQVLRSHNNSSKPLYVSVGHRVSLGTAVRLVRACCRFRIPEPIRQVRPRPCEHGRAAASAEPWAAPEPQVAPALLCTPSCWAVPAAHGCAR